MALVIYRKYRPQNFKEIVGQEHVVKTITNALLSKSLSHAYIFSGPRGSGKTTIARLLAKAVNCENPILDTKNNIARFESCNKCPSCKEISLNKAMNLIEIDAASQGGIDDIRELREGIKFSPGNSKFKVFIIDECHQLSKDASNALLKTLEEPPAHAIFILATTEIHKIIPTILSRCQRFAFRNFSLQEITKRLEIIVKKEEVKIDKASLNLIAINASGSIRDAESLLGQVLSFSNNDSEIKSEEIKNLLGLVGTDVIANFTDSIYQKDAKTAIKFLNEINDKGIDIQEFSKSLIGYLRQCLVLKTSNEESLVQNLTDNELLKMKNQLISLNNNEIKSIISAFLKANNEIRLSSIPQLPLELAIIDTCRKES